MHSHASEWALNCYVGRTQRSDGPRTAGAAVRLQIQAAVPSRPQSPLTEDAFSLLYRRHSGQITSVAQRIVRNHADAEDVLQQAFAQAWRTFAQYDAQRGDVPAWLCCIARARALDLVRARRRQERAMEACGPGRVVRPIQAEEVGDAGRGERLRAALDALPETARDALRLMYEEDLTHRQTAAVLGKPLGTVKALVRRALAALRALDEDTPDGRSATREHSLLSVPLDRLETAFTTRLLEDPDAPAFRSCRRPAPRLQPLDDLRVVVVDDDDKTRELLACILGRAGARCTVCGGAQEAMDALEAVWPDVDVLVADISMPGEDGYSLISRVRALSSLRRAAPLPALAFTARGREDERARALLAGFSAHVSKPVHPAAVVSAVAALARRAA